VGCERAHVSEDESWCVERGFRKETGSSWVEREHARERTRMGVSRECWEREREFACRKSAREKGEFVL